jgi:ADP-ribose pyrophosphatase
MSTYYSKLVERKIKSKKFYRGVIDFLEDTVRLPNGSVSKRAYIGHHGAAAILPIFEDGSVALVEQYRYPVKKTTLEIPAGKMKAGQTPVSCAKAELSEETGYTAKTMKLLLSYCPSTAFSNEVLRIYIARGLKAGAQHPDKDEFLNLKIVPLKKTYELIKKGKIIDSKTIIALLYYKTFLEKSAL